MLRKLRPSKHRTKVAKSLTAQLRDVVRAFCMEVYGQALTTAGVSIESKFRAPDKVYYLPPPPSSTLGT